MVPLHCGCAVLVTLFYNYGIPHSFDTINHDILLFKLNHYGIRGISNIWFASYLLNRKQYIEINKCKSSLKKYNKWSTSRIHIRTCAFSNSY